MLAEADRLSQFDTGDDGRDEDDDGYTERQDDAIINTFHTTYYCFMLKIHFVNRDSYRRSFVYEIVKADCLVPRGDKEERKNGDDRAEENEDCHGSDAE